MKKPGHFFNFRNGFTAPDVRMTSELSSYRVRKKLLRDEPAFSGRTGTSSLGMQAGSSRALRRLQFR